MAVRVPNFNFKGFYEHQHLVPYKALFASECSTLRGQNLCNFLAQMDQSEYQVIQAENIEFKNFEHTTRYLRLGTLISGLWSVISFIGFFYYWKKYDESWNVMRGCIDPEANPEVKSYNRKFTTFFISSITSPWFVMLFGCARNDALKEKCSEVYQSRVLRLEGKIRRIANELIRSQDQGEVEQLHSAQDFFSLKCDVFRNEQTNFLKLIKVRL
jgi:hypothetical protein